MPPDSGADPPPNDTHEVPMTTTTYRMAGLEASAAASRARLGATAGLTTNACSWPVPAVKSAAVVPATAKQMFVDSIDHRRRRLSEPSP